MKTKIHVMHIGAVYIDQALAFREKSLHPAPYTGWFRPASKKRWVPVSSYLIEHPNGLVLIDTGWNVDVRTNQKQHLGRFAYSMFRAVLPEGKAIHEQLGDMGFSDSELDFVVLTHLHSDHVSGLRHVSNAKQIIVSELELKAANKELGYVRNMWRGIDITPIGLQDIPYGPYRLGVDLFGDQTIFLVHTPGHSKGQLSVLVATDNGWILLASDVGYSANSWEQDILPGIATNKEQAHMSLKWVKEFAKREDCSAVLANHDPSISPRILQ